MTPEPHPHCIHECVCSFYKARNGECSSEPCDLNTKDACPYSSPTSAEQVLEKIETRLISEATKAKGWMNKTLGVRALINEMEVAAKEIAELRLQRGRELE